MAVQVIRMPQKVLVQKMARLSREIISRRHFTISDQHAFDNVKAIAKQEGLLVGSSSGAALQGALELKTNR